MKKYIKFILLGGIFSVLFGVTSCTDYLDKAEDTTVSSTQAFMNFNNFQGFTEELYNCIPDFAKGYWTNSFNWGEDEITTIGVDYHYVYKIDNGNFWGWQSGFDGWQSGWMDRNSNSSTANDRFQKSLWTLAWYGIRKANLGIENLDKLKDATDEQKSLIAGQLYFFRGWFHFELMQYFGGLPYINTVLPSDQKLTLPRLKYQECADLAAADFRKAADLLPIDWDNTVAGKTTQGKNQLRINKIMALGYLGKNYLWAGSPLMNYESTGNKTYNAEYCKKAAEAFGELLSLVESGKTQYALVNFTNYSDIFFTNGQNWKMPGSTEAIFRGPSWDPNSSNWGLSKQYQPGDILKDGTVVFAPTANYVDYYGMANGLPINATCDGTVADTESGYDPQYPWRNRDPRFYHDIVFDTKKCVKGTMPAAQEVNRYANLYTGGSYRNTSNGSRTGYLMYKFIPMTANKYDGGFDWGNSNHIHIPWMRLADIYLMYAESAVNAYGSPYSSSSNFDQTAVWAVNKIRTRAGVGEVNSKFLGSINDFMSEVRRERAVELAYEGHRFNDLRRWRLLTESPYTLKKAAEFDRAGTTFNTTDPSQNKVLNMKEVVLVERRFSEKHYWLPLKVKDVSMYAGFNQNPGW